MKDLKLGHRVEHKADGRRGMVFGHQENKGVKDLLFPIALEGSTRKEFWPVDQIILLPKAEQLIALGGNFNPPKGFPLNIK